MLQARKLGKELFVGVHSDEAILENKGPTVMTLEERLVWSLLPRSPLPARQSIDSLTSILISGTQCRCSRGLPLGISVYSLCPICNFASLGVSLWLPVCRSRRRHHL